MNEQSNFVPLGQEVNEPKDVANAMLWLASGEASFVTGEILIVDGGQHLTTNKY